MRLRTGRPMAALFITVMALTAAGPAVAQVGANLGLLDPELATPSELAAVGLTPAQVDAILAGRPFADMLAVDAALGLDDAGRDAVYRRMFLPVNLETATAAEFSLVPGMSEQVEAASPGLPSLAAFRAEIAKEVDAAEAARLEQYVFSPMDLNTATEEDFATIPGMDDRMIDEFLEYRPYTAIEQFRVEIGKYVDADEVARLERYVTIR